MNKYEISVSIKDHPTNPYGKKQGDIISVIPAGRVWGSAILSGYLIVPVLSTMSYDEIEFLLTMPYYEGGLDEYPEVEVEPPLIAKNRYQIPLDILKDGWLPDIDLKKITDKNYAYQPLKKESDFELSCDCITGISGAETEIVIDMSEKVSIVLDKFKGTYKYSTRKVF